MSRPSRTPIHGPRRGWCCASWRVRSRGSGAWWGVGGSAGPAGGSSGGDGRGRSWGCCARRWARAAAALRLRIAEGGVGVRNERPPVIGSAAFAGLLWRRQPAVSSRFAAAGRHWLWAGDRHRSAGGLAAGAVDGAAAPGRCDMSLEAAGVAGDRARARGEGVHGGAAAGGAARGADASSRPRWQQSRVSLTRLAQLLRRDSLRVALRLSGTLDGRCVRLAATPGWRQTSRGRCRCSPARTDRVCCGRRGLLRRRGATHASWTTKL